MNLSRILVSDPMSKYVSDPWCGGAGVISAKFIQENPEDAEKFVNVMLMAINKTYEDKDSRQYLIKYLGMSGELVDLVPLPPIMTSSQNLDASIEQGYQKFIDVFYEFNVTTHLVDVRDMFLD